MEDEPMEIVTRVCQTLYSFDPRVIFLDSDESDPFAEIVWRTVSPGGARYEDGRR